jgi:serine/threonine protein phosphatase PrpC
VELMKEETGANDGAMIWSQQDLTEARVFPVATGTVAVYTARSPDKATMSEDVVAVFPCGPQSCVLMVADGVGGLPAGEEASKLTADILGRRLAAAGDSALLMQTILDGIDEANRALLASGTGAATTLAVVEIQAGAIRSYHIGDSMILVTGQRGKVKLQTTAHSPVGYAIESGLLDEAQAMHHEHRHVVSNVVGIQDMRIEIGPTLRLAARDTLLIASDGLPDNLFVDEIIQCVCHGQLEAAARRLVQDSRQRMQGLDGLRPGHADDLSFILFRLDPVDGRGEAR